MKYIFLCVFLVIEWPTFAQDLVLKPSYLKYEMSDTTKEHILSALEGLYSQLVEGNLDEKYIGSTQKELTLSTLETFQAYEQKKDSIEIKIQDKQLINFYPIGNDQYWMTISYQRKKEGQHTTMYMLNLVAEEINGKVFFSIPLEYLTRYWKIKQIGNIRYHFREAIQLQRAETFDQKNTIIANKLGLEPEKMDFYMCDNRQEILKLQGLEYDIHLNGKVQDGYGVDANTIFSIQNNESFSHDIFHYYSGKIHKRVNRNWITEEGVAYCWGNAYYTNVNGEMIELNELVHALNSYLTTHTDVKVYDLFNDSPPIFDHISTKISVRSTISGIIVSQVEKEHGVDGVIQLVNCGRKDRMNRYMATIELLLGVTPKNFDEKLNLWIQEYPY